MRMQLSNDKLIYKMWQMTDNTSWTEPHTCHGHSIGCWVGIKAILHGSRGECALTGNPLYEN